MQWRKVWCTFSAYIDCTVILKGSAVVYLGLGGSASGFHSCVSTDLVLCIRDLLCALGIDQRVFITFRDTSSRRATMQATATQWRPCCMTPAPISNHFLSSELPHGCIWFKHGNLRFGKSATLSTQVNSIRAREITIWKTGHPFHTSEFSMSTGNYDLENRPPSLHEWIQF